MTLQDCVDFAIRDLRDWLQDNKHLPDLEDAVLDVIGEFADMATPVYSSESLRIAADNLSEIGQRECEVPAFDAAITPVNVATGCISDYILERLHEEWEAIKEEALLENNDPTT